MPDTVSCEPADLVAASKCFDCLTKAQQDSVMIYLLAVIAGETTDPSELMQRAKCMCIPPGSVDSVITYLLCQILSTEQGA